MPKLKGTPDIAPMVRGAFIRAAKQLADGGRPLSTILLEQLREHPLETLRVISSFIPKEMMIEATIHQELDELSDEALDREINVLAVQAGFVPGEEDETKH
jgi:hypothetical protein